jgi:hypothetical protein
VCDGRHHYVRVSIEGGSLSAETWATAAQNFGTDPDNIELIDEFTIVKKGEAARCEGPAEPDAGVPPRPDAGARPSRKDGGPGEPAPEAGEPDAAGGGTGKGKGVDGGGTAAESDGRSPGGGCGCALGARP